MIIVIYNYYNFGDSEELSLTNKLWSVHAKLVPEQAELQVKFFEIAEQVKTLRLQLEVLCRNEHQRDKNIKNRPVRVSYSLISKYKVVSKGDFVFI
jgi:hypothetical protein